jgi:thiamine-phosphate pyrophosphorylase
MTAIELDPFYPIVPDAGWAARLVSQGAKLIQLRIKDAAPGEIEMGIAQALETCAAHGATLVVNDYWREAIRLGAPFVHLGQEDLAAADLPALRAAGIKFGVSTHSHEELARTLSAEPDYVALGPIYPTKLKAMAFAPQGLTKIGEWRSKIDCPLVAIGGITLETAPSILAAGASSAAVVTDIVMSADPERRTRDWIVATEPWRKLSTGLPQVVPTRNEA